MNVRGVTRLATCKNSSKASPGALTPLLSGVVTLQTPRCVTWSPDYPSKCWVRGAKTKTVIEARELPQGVLPPLPPHLKNEVATKPYSETFQQHLDNMRKVPDCVLFTRVGDFYEMYFDHVAQYAPMLDLKQAKKKSVLGTVPMAGFQHWQLEKYLKILVQDHDLKVAIADQIRIQDGDRIKFHRPITRIVTKGTLIDESFLPAFESNYLLAIHLDTGIEYVNKVEDEDRHAGRPKVGLSWVDLSSGDFYVQTDDVTSLPSIIARIGPREIVLDSSWETLPQNKLRRILGDGFPSPHFHTVAQVATSVTEWTPMLERPLDETDAEDFTPQELAAGNIVLDYIRGRLQDVQLQLQTPVRRYDFQTMMIDRQSLRGLEIKSLLRDGSTKGSLLHAIRRTETKSGARLLSERIVSPSMALSIIDSRLDLVEQALYYDGLRQDIQALLRDTSDTFRLVQKFSIGRGDADDLLGLAATIDVTERMAKVLHEHTLERQKGQDAEHLNHCCFRDVLDRLDLDGPRKLAKAILNAIDEEGLTRQQAIEAGAREDAEEMAGEVLDADAAGETVPRLARRRSQSHTSASLSEPEDIWIMQSKASPALKQAHRDLQELRKAKRELTAQLREQMNSASLSLQWSPTLEHHCHLKGKDAKMDLASRHGFQSVRSSKTTRCFYHPEWTALGGRIDSTKLGIRNEEERVMGNLRRQVIENIPKLRRNAAVLDELDVACSSAVVAKERNFVRPKLNKSESHLIIGGRHPTVDVGLKENGRSFTANDCSVGDEEKIYLITGPNMAGKSTYLRQNALITILAQTGCFVPADYAEIGLVDKIFSRVGSADNLYQDQSTFMVEMQETAEILQHATEKSFVIMDEVGRGTTPEDGVAVGYACLHHLHHVNKCRALFATHFHVLADMTAHFDRLSCHCTDVVEEKDGSWMYVHKLRRGVNRESHALKVARMAGLPDEAITVAAEVLNGFQPPVASGESSERMKAVG